MGHDVSYAILEDGVPILHNELERFNRQKSSTGDGMQFMLDTCPKHLYEDADYAVHYKASKYYGGYPKASFNKIKSIVQRNGGDFIEPGHHQSHAAAAFFSSEFDESLIITFDGNGTENPQYLKAETREKLSGRFPKLHPWMTAFTVWSGKDNKIEELHIDPATFSWGGYYKRCTGVIFKLGAGHVTPKLKHLGFQGGTVMGMAALGNHEKYLSHFQNMLEGGLEPNPTDMKFLTSEADKSEQNRFDIAASLQYMFEKTIKQKIDPFVNEYIQNGGKNICLSGGVALNCVMGGAMLDWYPEIENIHHDPIPYDGGLAIGSARYLYHHMLDNPRIYNNQQNKTPYLGKTYIEDEVREAVEKMRAENKETMVVEQATDEVVIEKMIEKNIISVFGGGSESGRRALGNRSILADPRHADTKDIVNEKVKHRQWFRPFAPSVMREHVGEWFERDIDSPYMSFAIQWKADKLDKVPAVVHFDGSARLQTVTKEENEWYYNFINKFYQQTGVPLVLNTSFNDREPIVETPEHAISTFWSTKIDYLYFRDYGILISKK